MRKKLIAKIHVLKNRVCLDEDNYRAILTRITNKESCKDMTFQELTAVIEEFNRLFYIQKDEKYNTYESNFIFIDTNCAKCKKIFKLWVELGKKQVLHDSSNIGLELFLQKRFNTSINSINHNYFPDSIKDKIITALKNWLHR